MKDKALAALIRSQPEKGLEMVLQQYGGLCNGILRQMLGERPQDIEECLSTAICRLWQTIDRFDPEKGSLKSWLCRIVRNIAVDQLRRTQTSPLPLDEDWPDYGEDLTDQLQQQMDGKLIQQAIDQMEQPERTIFIRRYYYCEKVSSIAKALSMTEKAVEHRLARGRQKLKQYLLEHGGYHR